MKTDGVTYLQAGRLRCWTRCESTLVLMELDNTSGPEWHPIGYIVHRKPYEEQPAAWYAYWSAADGKRLLGHCRAQLDAFNLVEEALNAERGYSRVTEQVKSSDPSSTC